MTIAFTEHLVPSIGASGIWLSPTERERPPHIRDAIISTLFGRVSNVAMLAIAAVICGMVSFSRGGSSASIAIAFAEVLVIGVRCCVIAAFLDAKHKGSLVDARPWLSWFAWLAVASSTLWGALCLTAFVATRDPVLYTLPVLSTVGIAGSVAARNSGVPRLAKAQLFLSLTPIFVGCLFAGDHGFRALALLVPAMALGLYVLIDERGAQLVTLIVTQYELSQISKIDALTQIANRRGMDEHLDRRLAARRPFALLMIDVDHFKHFNDRYGHQAGDVLLRRIAAVLKSELRKPDDHLARYGGEEFVVVIDETKPDTLSAIATRMRDSVRRTCSDYTAGDVVTISIGITLGRENEAADDALRRADRALYQAKERGRDIAVHSDDRVDA